MATSKSNMKEDLLLSQAVEHLSDTICREMESTLILNSEYNQVLDVNTVFQVKQIYIWNRESSKG